MATQKVLVTRSKIAAIGDAIRAKTGTISQLSLDGMVTAINGITTQSTGDNAGFYRSLIDGTATGVITLPDDLAKLRTACLYGLENITGVNFNTKITEIPDYCFKQNNIAELNLPENITSISRMAITGIPKIKVKGKCGINHNAFTFTYGQKGEIWLYDDCTIYGALGTPYSMDNNHFLKLILLTNGTEAEDAPLESGYNSYQAIYTKEAYVDTYKNKTNFAAFSSIIKPLYKVINLSLTPSISDYYAVTSEGTQFKKGEELQVIRDDEAIKIVSPSYDVINQNVDMSNVDYFGSKDLGITLTQNNATFTMTIPSGATAYVTYSGVTFTQTTTSQSYRPQPQSDISYTVKLSGYKDHTGTYTHSAIDDQVIVTTSNMANRTKTAIDIKAPFTGTYDLENLINTNGFEINGTKLQSGDTSYHVSNGKSFGYIVIDTPSDGTALEITANVSSEVNYDKAYISISNAIPSALSTSKITSLTEADSNIGSIDGTQIITYGSGTNALSKTVTLAGSTTYYIGFGYTKDMGVDNGEDRFYITEIKFDALQ